MPTRNPGSSPEQFDLLGGHAPSQIHRLFFALLPNDAIAHRIEAVASEVAATQHLRARMIRPSRYHATLHFLGDHSMVRDDIVQAAIGAARKVRCAPFDLVLDGASGFHGREPPCVLRCSQVPAALTGLWQDLRQALVLAGQGAQLSRNFTPHVTFAYNRGALPQETAIEPITWRVEGFALLHSVVGGGEYHTLDTWRFAPG
jgi:2'-5' RNA ligase